jgi:hypothetical protein
MDGRELARLVAGDLGPEVEEALERPDRAAARSLSLWATVTFLVAVGKLVVEVWQIRREHEQLVEALANLGDDLTTPHALGGKIDSTSCEKLLEALTPERRLSFTARMLYRFLPDIFLKQPGLGEMAKRQWVTSYMQMHPDTQRIGPLLLPFKEKDHFALERPVGWLPMPADPPGLSRVDVPRGFVTDLGSIPSYLWLVWERSRLFGNAAIYHDWLYWEQGTSRATADEILSAAMKDDGVDGTVQRLIWAGVRVFGGDRWQAARDQRQLGGKRVLKELPPDADTPWEVWRRRKDAFH